MRQARVRTELENRGVDGSRIIFTTPLLTEDYLARSALADLFLDTPFYTGPQTF